VQGTDFLSESGIFPHWLAQGLAYNTQIEYPFVLAVTYGTAE
jgi:hypothetical protein